MTGLAKVIDQTRELVTGTNNVVSYSPEYVPASGSFTSIEYTNQTGFYIKQGPLVHVWGRLRTTSITVGSASGDVQVTLPFACSSLIEITAGSLSLSDFFTSNYPETLRLDGGDAYFRMSYDDGGDLNNQVEVTDLDTGTNRNSLAFQITYITDES